MESLMLRRHELNGDNQHNFLRARSVRTSLQNFSIAGTPLTSPTEHCHDKSCRSHFPNLQIALRDNPRKARASQRPEIAFAPNYRYVDDKPSREGARDIPKHVETSNSHPYPGHSFFGRSARQYEQNQSSQTRSASRGQEPRR